jgi:hypothetical protein
MTIELADRLVTDGHITAEERAKLIVRNGRVWDDTQFVAELADNGDVYIHNRGAYPIVLKGYAA